MQKLCGCYVDRYHLEVHVPTTIFDPPTVYINVSKEKDESFVQRKYFKLNEMPKWNIPLQTILLSKEDKKTLERVTDKLLKKLPVLDVDIENS